MAGGHFHPCCKKTQWHLPSRRSGCNLGSQFFAPRSQFLYNSTLQTLSGTHHGQGSSPPSVVFWNKLPYLQKTGWKTAHTHGFLNSYSAKPQSIGFTCCNVSIQINGNFHQCNTLTSWAQQTLIGQSFLAAFHSWRPRIRQSNLFKVTGLLTKNFWANWLDFLARHRMIFPPILSPAS